MKLYTKSDYFKPLEQCSKVLDEDGVSEYDVMVAMSHMPSKFTNKQLQKELNQVVLNRHLSELVDQGLIEISWDHEQSAVVYSAKSNANIV